MVNGQVASSDRVEPIIGADGTNLYIQTANNTSAGVVRNTRRASETGYLRVFAWK